MNAQVLMLQPGWKARQEKRAIPSIANLSVILRTAAFAGRRTHVPAGSANTASKYLGPSSGVSRFRDRLRFLRMTTPWDGYTSKAPLPAKNARNGAPKFRRASQEWATRRQISRFAIFRLLLAVAGLMACLAFFIGTGVRIRAFHGLKYNRRGGVGGNHVAEHCVELNAVPRNMLRRIGESISILSPSPKTNHRFPVSQGIQKWWVENDRGTCCAPLWTYHRTPWFFTLVGQIGIITDWYVLATLADSQVFGLRGSVVFPCQGELDTKDFAPIRYFHLFSHLGRGNESPLHGYRASRLISLESRIAHHWNMATTA